MTRLGSFSTPRALIALAAALSASAASGAALMGCLRTQPPAAYGFGPGAGYAGGGVAPAGGYGEPGWSWGGWGC